MTQRYNFASQANYKIMAARLQHEIKELQQKAKAAKLRLETEIKVKLSSFHILVEYKYSLSQIFIPFSF
jgi:hypothetical protein